jgi:hypothetical protein
MMIWSLQNQAFKPPSFRFVIQPQKHLKLEDFLSKSSSCRKMSVNLDPSSLGQLLLILILYNQP